MSDYIDIQNQDFSFFGVGSVLKGEFHLRGVTHLASTLEGTLKMDDDSELIIEAQGQMNGEIACKDLKIYGIFSGKIEAEGVVTIYPSATFDGEITAANLIIHPGATVNMTGKTISV